MRDRNLRGERGGMLVAVIASCAIGAAAVGASLLFTGSRGFFASLPGTKAVIETPLHATEEYGKRLFSETFELLGPDAQDPGMRMSGSRLACASCHLGSGMEPGTLTLLLATEHYPRFSARAGVKTDIEDRVNECMTRSMNGKALARTSPEMIALAAYIRSLGARNAAMGFSLRKAKEPGAFKTPNRAANLTAGKQVFLDRCSQCHGTDGLGLLATENKANGYVFPPLWGPDSFNDGAGMHRVLTAARFIKARMPLGAATLNDDQSLDVAAYINSQPRPEMPSLEQDYPDRTAKPVDNGYGPFADSFSLEQHKYGPFPPIEAFYKKLKKAAK
ncbi:MAG: c-type cytochrome [Bryobacteraceae bacterium]